MAITWSKLPSKLELPFYEEGGLHGDEHFTKKGGGELLPTSEPNLGLVYTMDHEVIPWMMVFFRGLIWWSNFHGPIS